MTAASKINWAVIGFITTGFRQEVNDAWENCAIHLPASLPLNSNPAGFEQDYENSTETIVQSVVR